MNPASPAYEVARALRRHEDTLRRLRLRSLALFGSAARAEQRSESVLDLLYEFEEGAATLDRLLDLQSFLEELLGHDVDLVARKYLSPVLQRYIGDDVVTLYEAVSSS